MFDRVRQIDALHLDPNFFKLGAQKLSGRPDKWVALQIFLISGKQMPF